VSVSYGMLVPDMKAIITSIQLAEERLLREHLAVDEARGQRIEASAGLTSLHETQPAAVAY
jgi:hypothetical protein